MVGGFWGPHPGTVDQNVVKALAIAIELEPVIDQVADELLADDGAAGSVTVWDHPDSVISTSGFWLLLQNMRDVVLARFPDSRFQNVQLYHL